jgi:hypothetical protein
MTASIYDALKDCIGAPLKDIQDILKVINIDLFDALWIPQEGKELEFAHQELPAVIMYLIHAYSKQSKMLIFGADYIEQKRNIAERVGLPLYLHGKVVKLKSELFRMVMIKYLEYQGSRPFKHLQLKVAAYEAIENINFNAMFIENADTKKINENVKIKDSLFLEIQDFEDQLRNEFKFMFDNREDAMDAGGEGNSIDNGNLENSKYINYRKPKDNEQQPQQPTN